MYYIHFYKTPLTILQSDVQVHIEMERRLEEYSHEDSGQKVVGQAINTVFFLIDQNTDSINRSYGEWNENISNH